MNTVLNIIEVYKQNFVAVGLTISCTKSNKHKYKNKAPLIIIIIIIERILLKCR